MRSGSVMRASAASSASGSEFARLSDASQLGVTNAHAKIAAAATAPHSALSRRRRREATPIRSHTAESARHAAIRIAATSTTSRRINPCWNAATIAGGVYAAARSHTPPCTAAMKFRIHVPTVTLNVRMAAVDGCSLTAAATAAIAIVRPALKK